MWVIITSFKPEIWTVWNNVRQLHLSSTPVSKLVVKNIVVIALRAFPLSIPYSMLKTFNFCQENTSKRNRYFLPRWYLYYTGKVTIFLKEIFQIIAGYQVLGFHLPVKIIGYVCEEQNLKLCLFCLIQVQLCKASK